MKRPNYIRRCALGLLVLTMVGVGVPADAQTPPSMTGEQLFAANINDTPSGGTQVTGECDPAGTSTISFTATGLAFGPYPGTFTESGTFTIGPQTIVSPFGFGVVGPVQSFEATFTIDSPLGQVMGVKTLSLAHEYAVGRCTNPLYPIATEPLDSGVFLASGGAIFLDYTAHITAPSGKFVDEGKSSAAITTNCSLRCDDAFQETFTTESFRPAPGPPQTQDNCKNGGWRQHTDNQGRPFKNQGDCVSYVSTRGRNKARG